MNIVVLFNSGHPALGSWRTSVTQLILGTNVLQKTDRHMRVSIGDILTRSVVANSRAPTFSHLVMLCRKVYQPKEFDLLIRDRLDATYGSASVFCWVFQNMTARIAEALHAKLASNSAYLGAMDADFSNPHHLALFRNSLWESYRLRGNRCSIFYEMGENEDPDVAVREIFEQYGFIVDYEDLGARRSVFDDYDTIDHFRRVEDFKRVFAGFDGLSSDLVSNLALTLEELHPKLFDVFASVARTLERAETEEDLAQVALSGRRLLERTADYLFPPRKNRWKGRNVDNAAYKNRLWAYIEQTMSEIGIVDSTLLPALDKEASRLVDLFNKGLHDALGRKKVEAAFRDLALWLTKVIELSPRHARRQYLAYEAEFY
jgi:hypothetical protein